MCMYIIDRYVNNEQVPSAASRHLVQMKEKCHVSINMKLLANRYLDYDHHHHFVIIVFYFK